MSRRTSRQISKQVAFDLDLQRGVVREVIEAFISGVAKGIADGEEVCIEGLGTFKAYKVSKEASVTWCPKGQNIREVINTKACVRISFRRCGSLGKVLRHRWLTKQERGR